MLSTQDIKSQTTVNTETEIALLNLGILSVITTANTYSLDHTTTTAVNGTNITGSPMTNNTAYYTAWQDPTVTPLKNTEMDSVISYFTGLGYVINRKSANNQNLYWQVSW